MMGCCWFASLFYIVFYVLFLRSLFCSCTGLPNVGNAAEQSGSGGGLNTVEIVAIAVPLPLLIAAVAAAIYYFKSKDSQQYSSKYYASTAPKELADSPNIVGS